MKNKIQQISLVIISVFITLYIIESYLIFFPLISAKDIEQKELRLITENKGGVFRDKYSELFFLKKKKQIKVPINQSQFSYLDKDFFPLGSISNSNMLHCNENGYYSIYKSDKYGFNNGNYDWDRDQKKIDFFLIGDSFVHGACVNFRDTINGVLRKKYNLNVINVGMSGTGPLVQFATLKEFMKLKKTKKYIWFYYDGNDLENLNQELKNPILQMYLNDNTFNQQSPINHYKADLIFEDILKKEIDSRNILKKKNLGVFSKFLKLHHLVRLKNEFFRNIMKKFEKEVEKKELLEKYKIIIQKANIEIQKENAELILAYIPNVNTFRNLQNENNKKEIKEIAKLNNLKFIDFEQLIKNKVSKPLSLYPELSKSEIHFNEKGYKFIAEIIKNYK
jgi:hypothetical protein